MPTFTLFADKRADLTDWTGDFVDLVLDRVEWVRPYLERIWVAKLAFKIVTRIGLSVRNTESPLFFVFEDRPIRLIELYKLRQILSRWGVLVGRNGQGLAIMPPVWIRDP